MSCAGTRSSAANMPGLVGIGRVQAVPGHQKVQVGLESIRFPDFPHPIRAPALPSVLRVALASTDGKAGAPMKTDIVPSSQENKKSGHGSTKTAVCHRQPRCARCPLPSDP